MRYDLVCTQSKKANQMKMYLKSAGMSCFPILSSFLAALFFLFPNITLATEIKKEHFLDNFCHAPSTDKKHQMENNKSAKVQSIIDIPLGHKIALVDLKEGDTILKYGHDIGKVVKTIKKGDHVHVHNVKTKKW